VTGPVPTAKAVPLSTATLGVTALPAVVLDWLAYTPKPINPAITSTATTATDVQIVTLRRLAAAFCCSTIFRAAARSRCDLLIVPPSKDRPARTGCAA